MADQPVMKQESSSLSQSSKSQSYSASSSSTSTSYSSKSVKTTSSSKVMAMKSSSTTSSCSIRASNDSFSDHYAKELSLDIDGRMKEMTDKMNQEIAKVKAEFLHLMPGSNSQLVQLSLQELDHFKDEHDHNKLKLNFDITEFESDSVQVKAVGNKVEVHAIKRVKKGDEEHKEEYSRTYELPTTEDLDPAKVTSSFYKDGVLTIELPTMVQTIVENNK